MALSGNSKVYGHHNLLLNLDLGHPSSAVWLVICRLEKAFYVNMLLEKKEGMGDLVIKRAIPRVKVLGIYKANSSAKIQNQFIEYFAYINIFLGVYIWCLHVFMCAFVCVWKRREGEREEGGLYVCVRLCEGKFMVVKCMRGYKYRSKYVWNCKF